MKHHYLIFGGVLLGAAAAPTVAAIPPAQRISVSGTEFRVCNGSVPIWIAGCNTPWHQWNDFGGGYISSFWNAHYQILFNNKINASRVWITCSGEIGIRINNAGYVSGAEAIHWSHLDNFFSIAQERQIYVMATLIAFDHFKDIYTAWPPSATQPSWQCWRNWINSPANVDSYLDNYLNEFMNRYGQNPYLWAIDLTNEAEQIIPDAVPDWNKFQYFWGKAAQRIHEHPNNGGVLVTVGIGYVQYNSDAFLGSGGGNKVSDMALTTAAGVNDPDIRLDFWSPHYYSWQLPYVGNPFTKSPAAFFGLPSLDRPAIIGETPNKGGSDSNGQGSNGPRTLLDDFNGAYNNGWQGLMPWTSNGVGNGDFGDWDYDLNDASIPFEASHPGLSFPSCSVRTFTPTPTPPPLISTAAPKIEAHFPVPNPSGGNCVLRVRLLGDVGELELKVYSSSLTCVVSEKFGKQASGWTSLSMPPQLANLPPGIYHYRLLAKSGSKSRGQAMAKGSLMIYR